MLPGALENKPSTVEGKHSISGLLNGHPVRSTAYNVLVEGNRIEDYDLDAVVRTFQAAGRRAYDDGRSQDATDFLVAEHIACVLRGDYEAPPPGESSAQTDGLTSPSGQ